MIAPTTYVREAEAQGRDREYQVHRSTLADLDTLRDFSIKDTVERHADFILTLPSLRLLTGSAYDAEPESPDEFIKNANQNLGGILSVLPNADIGSVQMKGLQELNKEIGTVNAAVAKHRNGGIVQQRLTVMSFGGVNSTAFNTVDLPHADAGFTPYGPRRRAQMSVALREDGSVVEDDTCTAREIINDFEIPVDNNSRYKPLEDVDHAAEQHLLRRSGVALLCNNGSLAFAPVVDDEGQPWAPSQEQTRVFPYNTYTEVTETNVHWRPEIGAGVVRVLADVSYYDWALLDSSQHHT